MSELNKQQLAAKKLDKMFAGIDKKEDQQRFLAEQIVKHFKERISEDEGLAEDILKADKTWDKCNSYLYSMARKAANGKKGYYASDSTIFEWAEDYFREDDKTKASSKKTASGSPQKGQGSTVELKGKDSSPESKNGQKGPEKIVESEKISNETAENEKAQTILAKPVEEVKADLRKETKPKKNSTKKAKQEADGQMSLFDFLGGEAFG